MSSKIQVMMTIVCYQLLLLLLIAISVVPVSSRSIPNNKLPESLLGSNNSNHVLKLEYLGTVGEKSYYADSNLNLNWYVASEYCKAFDMTLATIETDREWDFLVEATSDFRESLYWTAAREFQSPSMYIWNGTMTHLNMTVIKVWNNAFVGDYFSHCGAFYVNPPNYGGTTEGSTTPTTTEPTTTPTTEAPLEARKTLKQHPSSDLTGMFPTYCSNSNRVLCQGSLNCKKQKSF